MSRSRGNENIEKVLRTTFFRGERQFVGSLADGPHFHIRVWTVLDSIYLAKFFEADRCTCVRVHDFWDKLTRIHLVWRIHRTDTVENEFQGAAKFCTYSRAKYLVGILYEIGIKLFFRRVSKKAKNKLKKNENQILLNKTSQVHCEWKNAINFVVV